MPATGCVPACTRSRGTPTPGPRCCARPARCAARWASAMFPRWARSTCRAAMRRRSWTASMPTLFPPCRSGRARYGLMLREDGIVFDDGTTSRLAADHFFVTTTTANAGPVHGASGIPSADLLAGAGRAACLGNRPMGLDVDCRAACARRRCCGACGGSIWRTRRFRSWRSARRESPAVPCACSASAFPVRWPTRSPRPGAMAVTVWEAVMQAGAPFGIEPYGMEALGPAADRERPCRRTGTEWADHGRRSRPWPHAEEARRLHRPRAGAAARADRSRTARIWSA